MLTTKYVRDNLEAIEESLERRKSDYPIKRLLDLDKEWRKGKTELQELQAKRNKASIEVAELKKNGKEIDEKVKSLAYLKEQIVELEGTQSKQEEEIDKLIFNMPNILHRTVPYGEDETKNVEVRKWGETRKGIGKSHEEILTELELVDIERAAKIAGARFFFMKGDLALLEQSLIRFTIDELVKKGYVLLAPPLMLRKKYYRGVTALGDFEDMLYKIEDPKEIENRRDYERIEDELFMIGTSEHPMAAMHAEETLKGSDLPLKYVSVSQCFRREAGAHGKDTKGIFRVHQFNKVEQFIFSRQEDSWEYFDEIVNNEEEIFKKLKIPYHVIDICTGDIGIVAAKKMDLEAWMPSQQAYREVTSASNCTDWQSLRLDIKYDEKGERKHAHTLNGTGIATNRALVAIVENYANPDGTITVPDVLVPYMGKSKIE